MLKLGSTDINKAYLGSTEINKIYLGADEVFSGAVVPFDPSQISDLALWLDASDAATITEVAGSVSQWNDKSGNGYNATQAIGSNQPITGNTVNGLNSIDFDGSSDKMGLPSGLYDINQSANSLFYVFKMDTVKNTRAVVGGLGNTSQRWGAWFDVGASSLEVYGGAAPSTSVGGVMYDTNQHIYYQIGNGSTFYGSYDDAIFTTPAAFTNVTFDRLFLGVNDSNNDYLNGRLCEVIIYRKALSSGEITQISDYLKTKWGTP